jgi:hypothetical protein
VWWPRSPTYPEGPEAKDNDDEVHGVCQKHKHIHVGDGALVRVDEVIELPDGHIELQGPMGQMLSVGWVEMQDPPESHHSTHCCAPHSSASHLHPQDTPLGAGAPVLTQTLHKFMASLLKHNGNEGLVCPLIQLLSTCETWILLLSPVYFHLHFCKRFT